MACDWKNIQVGSNLRGDIHRSYGSFPPFGMVCCFSLVAYFVRFGLLIVWFDCLLFFDLLGFCFVFVGFLWFDHHPRQVIDWGIGILVIHLAMLGLIHIGWYGLSLQSSSLSQMQAVALRSYPSIQPCQIYIEEPIDRIAGLTACWHYFKGQPEVMIAFLRELIALYWSWAKPWCVQWVYFWLS